MSVRIVHFHSVHLYAILYLAPFLFQIYSALNKCSTMELYKSFIVLFAILSSSYAFELLTVEPKFEVIPYGGKLRLTCNADGFYEWCKFIHNDKICDFQWKRDVWNITTLECSDFEGRSRFVGTYDNYECGMELDNVTPEGIVLNQLHIYLPALRVIFSYHSVFK